MAQEQRTLVLNLIENLKLPRHARILEIGCGSGNLAVEIARRGFHVVAIDTEDTMLEATLRAARRAGVDQRVKLRRGSVESLEFPAAEFDLVIALRLLPCAGALQTPLREVGRVTRFPGFVVSSIPHRWAIQRVLDPARAAWATLLAWMHDSRTERKTRTCSIRQFCKALERAGLQVENDLSFGFGPFTLVSLPLLSNRRGIQVHHYLQGLANRGKSLLRHAGAQYIAVARRA